MKFEDVKMRENYMYHGFKVMAYGFTDSGGFTVRDDGGVIYITEASELTPIEPEKVEKVLGMNDVVTYNEIGVPKQIPIEPEKVEEWFEVININSYRFGEVGRCAQKSRRIQFEDGEFVNYDAENIRPHTPKPEQTKQAETPKLSQRERLLKARDLGHKIHNDACKALDTLDWLEANTTERDEKQSQLNELLEGLEKEREE